MTAASMNPGRYRPGQSGNPAGRKPGTRNRLNVLRAGLVTSEQVREIAETVVRAALEGDVRACEAVLDRVWPRLKSVAAPVEFALPEGSFTDQGRAVLAAVSEGRLSPDTGERLIVGLGALARLVELDELERRISALEDRNGT